MGNFRADRGRTHANKKCPIGPIRPLKNSPNKPECRATEWEPTWRKQIWKWSPDGLEIALSTFWFLHVLCTPNSKMVKMTYFTLLFIVKTPKLPYSLGFLPFLAIKLAWVLFSSMFHMFFTHIEWIYAGNALVQVQVSQLGHDNSRFMIPKVSSLSSFPTLNKRRWPSSLSAR